MKLTYAIEPRDLARRGLLGDMYDAAKKAGKWGWGKLTKGRLGGKLKPKPKPPA